MGGRRFGWWAVAGLLAGGCGGIPDNEAIQKKLKLQAFSSCDELEKYIEDTAVLDMRTQLEAQKRGGWGGGIAFPSSAKSAPDAAMGASAAPGSSGPNAYTTTNVQVAGVDEADFVKNDGTRIFVLSGDKLYINQSWPASQLRTVSKLAIEGWPREMFLDDQNHVVVFSTVYSPYPLDDRLAAGVPCGPRSCGFYYGNTVKTTVVDVSDLAHPRVQNQLYLPGSYANSRRIGASVRIVLRDDFRWPSDVKLYPESCSPGLFGTGCSGAIDDLIAKNEKLIRARSLSDWLPQGRRVLEDGTQVDLPYSCTDFYRSNAPTHLGLATIATLNLANPSAGPARTSVVAEPGEIYASTTSLYVASSHWWWWLEPGQKDFTYFHKFDITQPDSAVYLASGGVEGHIVDQFSMDEDVNGYFRVATTLSTRVKDSSSEWGRVELSNRVSVLGQTGDELKVVGQTEEMAKGERIYSSRFVGAKGFVVTYRQTDPLFTIDLSDPENPRRVGELKVPGFSTYIHPIDENHLLTIGIDTSPNSAGWGARALKLSLFDVSDFANPVQTFTQIVGTAYGWSEATYEHKAFNYFPERKLLAIPFADWSSGSMGSSYWSAFTSDLRVFRVDPATGITPLGVLSMRDLYQTQSTYDWTYYWSPWVRRSVMADTFAYAISDAGIRVADVSSLSTPVATVFFDRSAP